MNKEVRVGIVGLSMGRYHIERYLNHPSAKIQAVCDKDESVARRVGGEFKVPQVFTDFEEFLAKAEIDAVSLAIPNYLHKSMALACLDRGLHIMCEKPMAMDTVEALEMRDRVRKSNGLKFMIHYNQRFRPEHQYFKHLIASGELGNVYYGCTGWRRMRGMPRFGGWFSQKKMSGGGPLIDLGVHMLDLTRWLIGNPKVVTVSASTYSHIAQGLAEAQKAAYDVEDLASALIRFDNGSSLMLEVSWALNFEEEEKIYLELSGTKGGLSNVSLGSKGITTCIFREENGAMVKSVPLKYPPSFENAQQHFINCILEDRQPGPGADDGVETMRILDAIYESARIGREVELRSVDLSAALPEGPAVAAK